MSRLPLAALLVLAAAGCVRRLSPTQPLETAAAQASTTGRASVLALAGFHALLMQGDSSLATERFTQAVERDSKEPLALLGLALAAERVGAPERVVVACLDLLAAAPRSALAPIAARLVADHAARSARTAQVVTERAPALLGTSMSLDAANLLKVAVLSVQLARAPRGPGPTAAQFGFMTAATLIGPYSAWRHLEGATELEPEKDGVIRAPTVSLTSLPGKQVEGPFGPLLPRALRFDDGRVGFAAEPPTGNVYLLAADVQLERGGDYVLRTTSTQELSVLLDGARVLERVTHRQLPSTVGARSVRLEAGVHRVMIRVSRISDGFVTLVLQRRDGQPETIEFRPATGAPANWSGKVRFDDDAVVYADAERVRAALEEPYGDALARFLAAHDALGRDRDGVRRLLAGLPSTVNGPAVHVLRARTALADESIPARLARGRAAAELEAALAKDPSTVEARLLLAQLALDDGRALDALEHARAARDAHVPAGPVVHELLARINLTMGLDAAAASSATDAEKALGGFCEASVLNYDLAVRRDAIGDIDTLLERAAHCSGSLERSLEQLKRRGQHDAAIALLEPTLVRDQSDVQKVSTLVSLYVAARRFDEALAVLHRTSQQWPRNAQLLKATADVHELMGQTEEALAVREQALLLDGADLDLRRQVERRRTGRELLDQWAISTDEALKSYEAAPGSEDATSAFVLDAAAIRVFPDGTMVDRVHIIQKALDQQGVQDVAEVDLPDGARILTLRTLKPDGRSLEPEAIEGKEVRSLPGVQVGDLVEYEYLLAHPPRGPGQPGFTASPFYFQIAQQPNARSSYVVIAPKGTGLSVDAHNVTAPAPQVEGELEVLRHEERKVPPYIPEPQGPPTGNEWLPFVSVGSGERGLEGVIRAYADAFWGRSQITFEVEQFVAKALEGLAEAPPRERVKALYVAVQHAVTGNDAGLSSSAASTLAQERGSRTWLLKAALEAAGFEARLIAVRTFTADPAPYVFPHEALLPYVCVRATLPGGELVWLDPVVRFAPFGELPELATGEREAYALPEPGRSLEQVRTPPRRPNPSKRTTLKLQLSESGSLSGEGEDRYEGFDAAQIGETLESLSVEQRDQALQSSLARYFGGAELSSLEVSVVREVGAPVVVRYAFVAPRFARKEGEGALVASSVTYPLMLGRRYVTVPSRVTPLFIDGSENALTVATLTLPQGWKLVDPVAEVKLAGPSGRYERSEVQQGDVLTVTERFDLEQSRVSVKQYEAFGQFAGEVDLLQQRELLFRR